MRRSLRRARWSPVVVLVLGIWGAVAAGEQRAASGAPGPVLAGGTHVGELVGSSDTLFWRSPQVACVDEPSDRDHPNTPLCATGRFVYTVDVPAAAVLRVAVDHPWRGDSAILAVDGPGGLTQRTDDGFSAEIVLTDPAPGRWEITAELGIRGRPSHLRLRVAVQEEPGYRPRVLPNLRAMPPYEFGLDAPSCTPTSSPWGMG